jgi:hypothetical protein
VSGETDFSDEPRATLEHDDAETTVRAMSDAGADLDTVQSWVNDNVEPGSDEHTRLRDLAADLIRNAATGTNGSQAGELLTAEELRAWCNRSAWMQASDRLRRELAERGASPDLIEELVAESKAKRLRNGLPAEPTVAPLTFSEVGPVATHSWQPIDLLGDALEPPEPPTIGGIIYPGRRHWVTGEPESLKSWCAAILCVEEMNSGRTVAYIDFEMGRREILERLRALGADDELIRDRFIYFEPAEALTTPEVLADVRAVIEQRRPTLVAIDAAAGALALHGCDPNSGADVERFYRTVIEELRARDAAIIVLDHLTKDKEARGRYAIGSERKIGAADVHLRFEVVQPFGRGKTGRAKIETKKDRPGHLRRPRAADLELVSDPDTGAITWTFAAPAADEIPATFRPTALMEKVSIYIERCVDPPSRNIVTSGVKGNAAALRLAIDTLLRENYLAAEDGARGAKLLRSLKPYRQADEPTSSTSSDLVPTSTTDEVEHFVHFDHSPVGGGQLDEDEVEQAEVERLAQLARGNET